MDMQVQENSTLPLLNKRLSEVQKSIANILSAIEQGIFTPSTRQRLEELEMQKKDLEIEIAQESITRPMLDRDQIKFWFHRFRKMDASKPENRRRLVDSFVNSIILHDDRIEFYFNFKKGARTLSLTDLEKGSDTLDSLPPRKRRLRKHPSFSVIFALRRVILLRSYIRLTPSDIVLRAVLEANIISLLR